MSITSLSELFQTEPISWGCRGDPYLWQEMSEVLATQPLPSSEAQLAGTLEAIFERLVGLPITAQESSVFVERHAHGGMSSGHISLKFWCETALPLLLARYHAALIDGDSR
ncbi:hypothetical protein [Phytopseudomonas punonensis]|uniref:Uncharacterized protein n=1 Tax=Phytopseudomonas punonensis TaxID=1220495 RepID=A0A1M7DM88_9GAMM|nr:hypothetical protein [Pseudomonas punonensis]SHL80631.1 hypothetical protein SAMN05216288_2504 [Pseudomonas punonensis]